MLCVNCSKLAFLSLIKNCIKCHGTVNNNLSVLCESCSSSERQCSVCLKKIHNPAPPGYKGCGCGKK